MAYALPLDLANGELMNKEQVDSFARLLHQQRDHFVEEFRRAEQDLEAIAEERESELEEHAQEEHSARLLTRLDDRMLHAVKDVDLALQKKRTRICRPGETDSQ